MSNYVPDDFYNGILDAGSEQEVPKQEGRAKQNGDVGDQKVDCAVLIDLGAGLGPTMAFGTKADVRSVHVSLEQGFRHERRQLRTWSLEAESPDALQEQLIRANGMMREHAELGAMVVFVTGAGECLPDEADARLLTSRGGDHGSDRVFSLTGLLNRLCEGLHIDYLSMILDLARPTTVGRRSPLLQVDAFGLGSSALYYRAQHTAFVAGIGWQRWDEDRRAVHGRFAAIVQRVLGTEAGWDHDAGELEAALREQMFSGQPEGVEPELVVLSRDGDGPWYPPKVPIVRTPQPDSSVPTHLDIAATIDQLNRRPFARILGRRIWELNEKRRDPRTPKHEKEGAYIVHLHGPWGAGKSTVLNFLKDELRPNDAPTGWVVVDFNAWRTQSARPPWWTLVREIHRQARVQTLHKFRLGIWWHWVAWHWLMAAGPWLVASAVMVGVAYMLKDLDTATELIAGVVAGAITLAALGRSLMFGSAKAAESFMDHRKDATRPVKQRYAKLIEAIGQPVIVFVDDVDRCDKSYVVELLEGIQTLFRDAPVTFLIAADRKWICRSFEKHYEDFNQSVGDPARPLGYLFLEKLFQLSVSLPPMSTGLQKDFMRALLQRGQDPAQAEAILEAAEQEAEKKLDKLTSNAEVDRLIDETKDVVQRQAIQRVSAKRLASVQHDRARQHELEPFSDLLEPNPRAMKRLLNAYGMQQSLHRLENRRVPVGHLARWTMVELRWPLFAEYACQFPYTVDMVGPKAPVNGTPVVADNEKEERLSEMPKEIRDLLDDPHLTRVVGVNVNGGREITREVLLSIVGGMQEQAEHPDAPMTNVQPPAQTASA